MVRTSFHLLFVLAVLGNLLPVHWCCALGLAPVCCAQPIEPVPVEQPPASCCGRTEAPSPVEPRAPIAPGKPAPCCVERPPVAPVAPLDLDLDLVSIAYLPREATAAPSFVPREVEGRSLVPPRRLHLLKSLWLC